MSIPFDRAANYYDDTRGFPEHHAPFIARLFTRAGGLPPTSAVLEIGVGTGRIALPLTDRVRVVHGIDLSLPMLARLRAKQSDEAIHVAQADAMQLPYRTHAFDAVVAVHVFHLVDGWQRAVDEAGRVLKPGGTLLLGRNGGARPSPLWEVWREVTADRRHSGRHLTDHDLVAYLESSGWRAVGERQFYIYMRHQTPQSFIDDMRARVWSHTWHMTDSELAEFLTQFTEAVRGRYPDLHAPVEIPDGFQVMAYMPASSG